MSKFVIPVSYHLIQQMNDAIWKSSVYTENMKLIRTGACTEDSAGNYWHEDTNLSEQIWKMDEWAIKQALHFVQKPEGLYMLAPAPKEEIDTYEQIMKQRLEGGQISYRTAQPEEEKKHVV